jgi:hypothetical protein
MQKRQNKAQDAALSGNATQGNPEAAAAAKKAKDALTQIDSQPSHPLAAFQSFSHIGSTPVVQSGDQVWDRNALLNGGMDVDSMLFYYRAETHQKGGLICICGERGCNIGPFVWRN